jgi:hypothetical protein
MQQSLSAHGILGSRKAKSDPQDDPLAFAVAIRLALPLGLALWAVAIWALIRIAF